MQQNINLNYFFPTTLNGISFETVGENSNQTVWVCTNSQIILVDGEFTTLTSASEWLDESKVVGGSPSQTEYKILSRYFEGISYRTGGADPHSSPPKSCIIVKASRDGTIGSLISGVLGNDVISTISGWADKGSLNLTFNINNTSIPLTLDASAVTTMTELASMIQDGLRNYNDSISAKRKANNAPYATAICTWDANTSRMTVQPTGAIGSLTLSYAASESGSDLAGIIKLTKATNALIINGLPILTLGETMQRLINFGVMNFSQFQTMYYDVNITSEATANPIVTAIQWTDAQKLHFTYLLTCKMSELPSLLEFLVAQNLFKIVKDQDGNILRYEPLVGSIQISVLLDGVDANNIARTQANNYGNCVIGGAIVGASGNRYASTKANCRNIAGTEFDNVSSDYITSTELTLVEQAGAIAYASLPGNAAIFTQCLTSGRNTSKLVWFDLWQNALFMGYRIQLAMVQLERDGILNLNTARATMEESVTDLQVAGFVQTPAIPLDYKASKLDNDYITYATTREFGIATDDLKSSVQSSLNTRAISFNIVSYDTAVDQGFAFKHYIEFVYDFGNPDLLQKLTKKLESQGKIVVLLKHLPRDIEEHLGGVKNRFCMVDGKQCHKPLIIKPLHSQYKHEVLDDSILTYTPSTIREKGLINIVDFTPAQWFNGVATFLNQLNIG